MILVARRAVEQLAERGKRVAEAPEVAAGRKLPGYRSFEAAIQAQVEWPEYEDAAVQIPEDAD